MNTSNIAVERFDLREYVTKHGGEELSGDEWLLQCPSCGKDKLTVNVRKKVWHCWVCQEFQTVQTSGGPRRRSVSGAGDLISLIQKLEEVDRRAAIAKIASAGNITGDDLFHIPDLEWTDSIRLATAMNPPKIPYPSGWSRCSDSVSTMQYLRSRGISDLDVQHFGIFWCSSGTYANRLVFPVYESGVLVYFQARAMWAPQPNEVKHRKMLNPPRTDHGVVSSEVLMNLDAARVHPRVCITEGPVDCVHAGFDAVCSFGKQLSPTQIAKLVRARVMAIDLMWDADAQREAFAVGQGLTSLFDVRVVVLPSGDPGNYSRWELDWFRAHAHQLSGRAKL